MRRLLSRTSLRTILTVPFIIQLGLTVALVGWLSIWNGYQAVDNVTNELWDEIAERTLQHINEHIQAPQQVIEDTINSDRLDLIDLDNPDTLTRYLWSQMRTHEDLFITAVGYETGEVIGVGFEPDGQLVIRASDPGQTRLHTYNIVGQGQRGDLIRTDNFDVKRRPWYQIAVEAGGFAWTPIYPNQSQPSLILSAVSPIYRNDRLIGVTNATLSLQEISEFLEELEIGQSGQIFAIERSGELVASSTGERLYHVEQNNGAEVRERIVALESSNQRVRRAAEYLVAYFGDLEQIQQVEQIDFQLAGERQIVQVAPFSDEFGLDWLIVIVVPEADFMGQIYANTRLTILLCIAALIVAIAGGAIAARWLTQPLLRLNQAAKEIAGGNLARSPLQHERAIKTNRSREISELVRSFERMTAQLQTSFGQLQALNTALADSESRLNQFLESLPTGVAVHDRSSRAIYLNRVGKDLLQVDDPADRTLDDLVEQLQIYRTETQRPYLTAELPAARSLQGEVVHIDDMELHQPGRVLPLEVWGSPIYDERGEISYAIVAFQDISDRRRAEEQLIYNALHDTLTGLPNRSLLMQRLELAIERAQQAADYHFAVLFLDLDRFKVINDSLGHFEGDRLLVSVARKLHRVIRSTDLATRLGGDEFVILLEDIDGLSAAIRVAEQVFTTLETAFETDGGPIVVTTSIGIVFETERYTNPSNLLRDADIALYRAKAKGGARYEVFDTEMHQQALKRLRLERDLRSAIAAQALTIHYQPIVDLMGETIRLVEIEALIRWQHPSQGFISPADFIPIAEETGTIVALDTWVLSEACRQTAAWHRQFPQNSDLTVSVNLSVWDLRQPHLFETITTVLVQTGLSAHCLALEITESMLIENLSDTIETLARLRALGVQISIDDFGSGYSSLSYLCNLPIDILKIDQLFVSQMQADNRNHQIVQAIVALSNELNFNTIAEGIETIEQLQWLREMGCEFGQGYLFSRPVVAAEIATILAESSSFLNLGG